MEVKLLVPLLHGMRPSDPGPQEFSTAPFPYWAKVWPSALALCSFIAAHPQLVAGKKVLELAAGLGLPGMLTAGLAAEVTISDYAPEAVRLMNASIALNALSNARSKMLNWNALPADLHTDVLLLSDINYEPSAFESLYKVLLNFLNQGSLIHLSTPQRLMAKPFIERLLPYRLTMDEQEIFLNGERAFISVLVLSSSGS
jgi:predicted nicotinamide N-methyase